MVRASWLRNRTHLIAQFPRLRLPGPQRVTHWRVWCRTQQHILWLSAACILFVCESLVHVFYQFFSKSGISYWLKKFLTKNSNLLQICYLKDCIVTVHFVICGHINAVKCISFSSMVSALGAMCRRALQPAINTSPPLEMAQTNPAFLLTLWQESMPGSFCTEHVLLEWKKNFF